MRYDNFKINGVGIPNPTTFKIERYKVTNLTRLASAKMTGNLIARKHKYFFTYDALAARDLNRILDALWYAAGMFYTLEYRENNIVKTAKIYPGAIPTELHSAHSASWVWKGVNFDLIEQ